jgi:hypothetical protein
MIVEFNQYPRVSPTDCATSVVSAGEGGTK